MRAESAVEPTRSENITVTCRRSAVSWTSGAAGGAAAAGIAEALFSVFSRLAIARKSLRRWPSKTPSFSKS